MIDQVYASMESLVDAMVFQTRSGLKLMGIK